MKYVRARMETAEKWGFKIEYFFGDCTSKFDYKGEEFNRLNKKSYPLFAEKFGENWQIRLIEMRKACCGKK